MVNNVEGSYKAVDHLIKQGYDRIAYISGLQSIPSTRQREEGYRKALEDNGLVFDSNLVKSGDSKHDSGVKLCAELLDQENRPNAIFAGNNLITLGALETIHNRSLKVPEEIAIVGFDDMYWSCSLNPPLTAVRQPAFEMGRRAGELLIQRINDPERSTVQMILNTELMKRSST